jgi:DNA invertase Pin-like site-specific DNA recombinase
LLHHRAATPKDRHLLGRPPVFGAIAHFERRLIAERTKAERGREVNDWAVSR